MRRLVTLIAVVAVIVAACGGDDDDDAGVVAGQDGDSVTAEPRDEGPDHQSTPAGDEPDDASTPPSHTELTGTTWLLDAIVDDGTASAVLDGTAPELRLDAELALFDGCNSVGGSYELDGDVLRVGTLRATLRGCADDVMQQAGAVVAVLGSGPTVSISGDRLTLTAPDGQGLSFVAG